MPSGRRSKSPAPRSTPSAGEEAASVPKYDVGVAYFKAGTLHAGSVINTPFKIYYPCLPTRSAPHATVFKPNIIRFLSAYLHVFFGAVYPSLRAGRIIHWLVSTFLLWPLGLFFAARKWWLPKCLEDAPIRPSNDEDGYPVIFFSHGLTGTGAEHAAWFHAWASRGWVVVSIWHCDRSAALSPIGGSNLWYEHPNFNDPKGYNVNFRLDQVERRADEFAALREVVLSASKQRVSRLARLAGSIDASRVILGGFSYGAATTALVASRAGAKDTACRGLLLLDGWFNIDFAFIKRTCEKRGTPPPKCEDQMAFPPKAHAKGSVLAPPCIFVGSEEFNTLKKTEGFRALSRRTEELQGHCKGGCEVHVLNGTVHWNFQDLCMWIPEAMHGLCRKANVMGPAPDARGVHRQVSDLLIEFAERCVA